MAGDAIKTARIQSRGSALNVFWATRTLQTTSILAAIGHAAARLNPSRGRSSRSAGRHAAPARGRHGHR